MYLGPSYIYGDNMSVIHNTQRPESTLKKKSNSICYHAIRELVAMGESLTEHVKTADNPADLATKIMANGQKWQCLVNMLLYDIFDEHDDMKDEKEAEVTKKKQEVDALTPLQPKHKKKRC